MFFLFCFFKSQCIYLTVIVIATAWLNYLPDSETTYEFIHGYNTPTLSNNYNTMQLNVLVVIIVIRFAMYLYYEYIYFSYFTQCCVCGCVLCSSVLLISIFNIVEFLFLIFFFFTASFYRIQFLAQCHLKKAYQHWGTVPSTLDPQYLSPRRKTSFRWLGEINPIRSRSIVTSTRKLLHNHGLLTQVL